MDIHSELLREIYEKENTEGLDDERVSTIRRRIEEVDSGNIEPLDAFGELARM